MNILLILIGQDTQYFIMPEDKIGYDILKHLNDKDALDAKLTIQEFDAIMVLFNLARSGEFKEYNILLNKQDKYQFNNILTLRCLPLPF